MRVFAVLAASFALAACTQGDRDYLLTYDKPEQHAPDRAYAPPPAPAVAVTEAPVPAPVAIALPPTRSPVPVAMASLPPQSAYTPREIVVQPERSAGIAPPPQPGYAPREIVVQPARTASMAPPPQPAHMPREIVVQPERPAIASPPVRTSYPGGMPPERTAPVAVAAIPAPSPVDQPVPRETIVPEIAEAPPLRAAAIAAPSRPEAEAKCRGVAKQRSDDAGLNGYDDDMRRVIYDGTFKDCMKWEPGGF